eukprot:208016_1
MHFPSIQHLVPVSIFNIALDEWAVGKPSTTEATITIQAICLLIAFGLFFIRLYQVLNEEVSSLVPSIQIRLLQFTHLAAMFFSASYILTHFWNYVHAYKETNALPCDAWYHLVILNYYLGKTFTYAFLMLRSAFAFNSNLFAFQIPLYVSLTVIVCTTIGLWIPNIIVLSNFTPIQPIPGKGFCFRIPGPGFDEATIAAGFVDTAAAIVAGVIFWRKAVQINSLLKSAQDGLDCTEPERADTMSVNAVFKKHIYLGSLIFISTFIVWWVVQLFTVLIGICVAIQNVSTNFYIFLLFKENNAVYNMVCCKAFQPNPDITNLSQSVSDGKIQTNQMVVIS